MLSTTRVGEPCELSGRDFRLYAFLICLFFFVCFSWQPVIEYIESRYEEFLNAESRVNRKSVPDNRVHCCLYMIAPSGHGLKPLDVELMKRLHDKVNLIPLIAKADTMTPEECAHFKKQVPFDRVIAPGAGSNTARSQSVTEK